MRLDPAVREALMLLAECLREPETPVRLEPNSCRRFRPAGQRTIQLAVKSRRRFLRQPAGWQPSQKSCARRSMF